MTCRNFIAAECNIEASYFKETFIKLTELLTKNIVRKIVLKLYVIKQELFSSNTLNLTPLASETQCLPARRGFWQWGHLFPYYPWQCRAKSLAPVSIFFALISIKFYPWGNNSAGNFSNINTTRQQPTADDSHFRKTNCQPKKKVQERQPEMILDFRGELKEFRWRKYYSSFNSIGLTSREHASTFERQRLAILRRIWRARACFPVLPRPQSVPGAGDSLPLTCGRGPRGRNHPFPSSNQFKTTR